jgi:sugar (pentulose or hexulose) kinase
VTPDPALVEAYAAQRERFAALYPALATLKATP